MYTLALQLSNSRAEVLYIHY